MEYALESEPIFKLKFKCKQQKQKLLIHTLLKCSNLHLQELSSLLDIPESHLLQVYQGHNFLNGKQAIILAKLLFVYLED